MNKIHHISHIYDTYCPSITYNVSLRKHIRKYIRNLRKHIPDNKQKNESIKIAHRIMHDKQIIQAKNIALFMSFDGEIQTDSLIKNLINAKKIIYLPVLDPTKQSKNLLFAQYTLLTPMIYNHYNILEPKFCANTLKSINQLDIIFVPLVAFDKYGYRLGMGGGFYDYTLRY